MEVNNNRSLKKLNDIKILGFPLYLYLVLVLIIGYIAIRGSLLNNMVGALAFALIVGTLVGWIGDRIPIWNAWFGGGMLLAMFFAAALATYKLVPDSVLKTISTFNNETGFLELYILVLITGAILSIERHMLLKAFAGFIPAIFGSIIVSAAFTALAALLVGSDPFVAQMDVMLPIMGGGNGAGVIPMSKIWGEITGKNPQEWYAPAFAVMQLGNLVSVISAAMLDKVGKKYPRFTGNGQMMIGIKSNAGNSVNDKEIKIGIGEYASGFALALFLYVFADFWASKVSFINNAGWGFTIHKFAYMVIFAALLNLFGLIPEEIRAGAKGMQNFFTKYMSFPLMITIGVTTNLMDFAKAFTIGNMVMIIACVIGAMVGAVLIGYFIFKFYPIEIAITAGLDMAGGGGSGDVQILGACHRMELMSFAQISSRIGGAIMLIISSALFGFLA